MARRTAANTLWIIIRHLIQNLSKLACPVDMTIENGAIPAYRIANNNSAPKLSTLELQLCESFTRDLLPKEAVSKFCAALKSRTLGISVPSRDNKYARYLGSNSDLDAASHKLLLEGSAISSSKWQGLDFIFPMSIFMTICKSHSNVIVLYRSTS